MEFKDELRKYTKRLESIKDTLQTGRSCKNVFNRSILSASWI